MIKINLALKKAPASLLVEGSSGRKSASLQVEDLKELAIRPVVVPVVICCALYFLSNFMKEQSIKQEGKEIDDLKAERATLDAELNKMKSFEEDKKALDTNQQIIRTKVDTIQKLIEERGGTAKILQGLSGRIPSDLWLEALTIKESEVQMKGSSLDYSLISTFKNGLEEGRILFETEIPDLSQAGDASPNSGGLAAFQLKGKRK